MPGFEALLRAAPRRTSRVTPASGIDHGELARAGRLWFSPSRMDEFDGSRVLERLAEVGQLEEFSQAIDVDDANRLMRVAGIDRETVEVVLRKMRQEEDEID